MSRATDALLDELHALVAGTLKDDLAAAREAKDEQGKRKPVPSSLILAAMKFLKDNGIDAPGSAPRFTSLVQELRDIDFNEADEARPN